MKSLTICLVWLLLAVGAPVVVFADEIESVIKSEAEAWARCVLVGDFEGSVEFTPERVIAMMGGKESMLATLKRAQSDMKAAGVVIESVTVDAPEKMQKIGGWLTSKITTRMVAKAPGGHVTQYGALLGISEDGGRTWVFLSLENKTEAQLAKAFPELAGKVALPEMRKPVFTKDP